MCKWYEGCKDGKGLLKALNMTILDKCIAIREDRIRFSEQLEGVAALCINLKDAKKLSTCRKGVPLPFYLGSL